MVVNESQNFKQTWVMTLLILVEIPVIILLTVQWLNGSFGENGFIHWLIYMGIFIGILFLMASFRLDTRMDQYGLQFRCPPMVPRWKKFPKEDIVSIKILDSGLMWKYGGLGIRYNLKQWAYLFNNKNAIQVVHTNGKFILSTRKPEEIRSMWEEWKNEIN